jgi:hypothetical protein
MLAKLKFTCCFLHKRLNETKRVVDIMGDEDDSLDKLAAELRNDEYPLPEGRGEKEQITYKNVDVTIKFRKETETDSVAEERHLFTDANSEFNNLLFDEAKGILKVPIVLAKEMIYHYDDYDAFRPADELEAIANYIKGIPVTRGHPEEKIVTDRGEVMGWAMDPEFEDGELRAVLEISDKDLIFDIQSGKLKGVSPGHFSRIDKNASGEFEGKHYDVTQRDIFVDHIAIVEEGRCNVEDGCGIMFDTKEEKNDEIKKKNRKGDEGIKMVSDSIMSELEAAIKLAEKLDDNTLKGKLEKVKKALEAGMEEMKEGDERGADKEGELEKEEMHDEAMKTLEKERDDLKAALDGIVEEEKTKIVDELGTLQEVKTEEQLKTMSLDVLKSDLELVKALKGTDKIAFGDMPGGEKSEIAKAYMGVGKVGGKE